MQSTFATKVKNNFNKIITILLLIIFFIYAMHITKKPNATTIMFGQNTIYTQIADTENKRSLGLSYTKSLDKNAGMLFVFDEINVKNFWMRDMNYDLDIIWIAPDKTINGFFENVLASSYNSKDPALSKIFHSTDIGINR